MVIRRAMNDVECGVTHLKATLTDGNGDVVTVIFLNVIFSRLSIRNPPKIFVVSFPVPTNEMLLRVILSVVSTSSPSSSVPLDVI